MPITVTFHWNRSAIFERIATAVVTGLEETGKDAFNTWSDVAPISDDPRTRGDLRKMFATPIEAGEFNVALILNAYAPHAKFVELGTFKDPAQFPLRRTAAMVIPLVPGHIRAAAMEL